MAPRLWGNAIVEENSPRLPNLEPDQFWFVVRLSGQEDNLLQWVNSLKENSAEDGGFEWAQVSAKLDFAKFFERDHPIVEAAREKLGLTTEDLDALWQYGSN